jgi:hypothetical protein
VNYTRHVESTLSGRICEPQPAVFPTRPENPSPASREILTAERGFTVPAIGGTFEAPRSLGLGASVVESLYAPNSERKLDREKYIRP